MIERVRQTLERRGMLQVVEALASARDVSVDSVLGKSRKSAPSHARQEAWARLHGPPWRVPYAELGRIFRRDEGTIRSGVTAAKRRAREAGFPAVTTAGPPRGGVASPPPPASPRGEAVLSAELVDDHGALAEGEARALRSGAMARFAAALADTHTSLRAILALDERHPAIAALLRIAEGEDARAAAAAAKTVVRAQLDAAAELLNRALGKPVQMQMVHDASGGDNAQALSVDQQIALYEGAAQQLRLRQEDST